MSELCIKVVNSNMESLAEAKGENEVNLFYEKEYEKGNQILIETKESDLFVWLQVDEVLGKSLVYLTGNVTYQIPFGEKSFHISPKAFTGDKHLLSVRKAMDFEAKQYRNLALNVNDEHHMRQMFPHAVANVETRGESVFAAQNAIDGITANTSHGSWPYQSWGINQQDDAAISIYFGREVEVDRIVLYTRADFPHDNWWEKVTLTFSDGSEEVMTMEKSAAPHELTFPAKKIDWVEMSHMIKAEDPSPFPALSQIEVYGRG